jgi:hypothetical protein
VAAADQNPRKRTCTSFLCVEPDREGGKERKSVDTQQPFFIAKKKITYIGCTICLYWIPDCWDLSFCRQDCWAKQVAKMVKMAKLVEMGGGKGREGSQVQAPAEKWNGWRIGRRGRREGCDAHLSKALASSGGKAAREQLA